MYSIDQIFMESDRIHDRISRVLRDREEVVDAAYVSSSLRCDGRRRVDYR
jgi:hypothetical protein